MGKSYPSRFKNRLLFICIAWYEHERGWENSRQLCKPETKSRVCITVENSPNHSSVYIRLCKYRKKVFFCIYKKNCSEKKRKTPCLGQWLKEKFSPVTKSCTRSLSVSVISSCFAIKMLSKNTGSSHLKCQLKRKKNWHSMFPKIFQVSADERNG